MSEPNEDVFFAIEISHCIEYAPHGEDIRWDRKRALAMLTEFRERIEERMRAATSSDSWERRLVAERARADAADESARMMSERVERLVKANLELKARADSAEAKLALCQTQRDNAEAAQRAMSERCERAEAKVQECVKMNELAAALREERESVEKGDGSTEHPFFNQFVGKMFERQDNKLSFGVCERDDGYELVVIPVRVGPVRYYRINPDGTIDDLAALAEGKPCPRCGGVGEHFKTATDILTKTDHGGEAQ